MRNLNRIRNTGLVCMAAAILWVMAISIEYPLHLQPPGSGSREPNQITETIWGLAWLLIGLVLYSNSRSLELVTV